MSFDLLNRVRMSLLSAPGTGPMALNTAVPGFQSFAAAGMAFGDTTPYVVEDGSPLGTVWEIGLGTLNSNGTLTRTTITQTSAGGTTALNLSANAIVSATFRGEDLAGPQALDDLTDVSISSPVSGQFLGWNGSHWANATFPTYTLESLTDVQITSIAYGQILSWNGSYWVNVPAPGTTAPVLVQYAYVQSDAVGNVSATFSQSPTSGNLILAIGAGGGNLVGGVYENGFGLAGADVSFDLETVAEFQVSYAFRSVRSGDPDTWQIGEVGSTSYPFAGVIAEIHGVDITRVSPLMVGRGSFSTTLSQVQALGIINALSILFCTSADTTCTVTEPMTVAVNNSDGHTRIVFAYNTMSGAWNGISATLGANVNNGVLVLNLPGV